MDTSHLKEVNDDEHFNLFATILADLDNKKQKRSHENVIKSFANHDIDHIKADEIINAALDKNFVYSYRYSKTTNYKLTPKQSNTFNELCEQLAKSFTIRTANQSPQMPAGIILTPRIESTPSETVESIPVSPKNRTPEARVGKTLKNYTPFKANNQTKNDWDKSLFRSRISLSTASSTSERLNHSTLNPDFTSFEFHDNGNIKEIKDDLATIELILKELSENKNNEVKKLKILSHEFLE